jgi:hypothetical protein
VRLASSPAPRNDHNARRPASHQTGLTEKLQPPSAVISIKTGPEVIRPDPSMGPMSLTSRSVSVLEYP